MLTNQPILIDPISCLLTLRSTPIWHSVLNVKVVGKGKGAFSEIVKSSRTFEVLIYTNNRPATRYSYLLGQKVPHALMCLFSGNLLVGVDLIRR